jgi:hypothetical protein
MRHRTRLPALLAFVMTLLGAAQAGSAEAQDLLPVDVAAQPMIHTEAGTLRSCGLRLFAAHVDSNSWIVAVETFIDVYVDGKGSFKGEVSEFSAPTQRRNANPVPVAVESIWVKSPDTAATRPILGKVDKGEGGHELLYAIEADSAIALMLSGIKGESILFGFKRSGSPAGHIYIGVPKLARDESEQLQRCLSNLTK